MRNTIVPVVALALALPVVMAGAQGEPEDGPERRAESRVGPARGGDAVTRDEAARPARDARMSGTFVLAVSRTAAEQEVRRAIDEVAGDLSFFVRAAAARRLREKNPVRDRLQTAVLDGQVRVVYGDEGFTTPNGQWRTVSATGEELRLFQAVRSDHIIQIFRAEDGQRQNVYRFSEDGSRVTIEATLTSPRLRRPLRYSLPYRRATSEGMRPA